MFSQLTAEFYYYYFILFTLSQKIVPELSEIWVGSETWDRKNLSRIRNPGVKKASDPGSLIRIGNTDLDTVTWLVNTLLVPTYEADPECPDGVTGHLDELVSAGWKTCIVQRGVRQPT
jgi:hypothetical protein